jgi:protease IV
MTEATPGRGGRARRILVRTLVTIGALTLILTVLFFVVVLAAARGPGVPREMILEIDLERGLVEHVPDDPIAGVLARQQVTVRSVVEALHRAAEDDRVVGLVARVGGGGIGLARAEELRDAVVRFRGSGKPTIVFAESFGEFAPGHSAYYLATAFDSIYMQPSGDLGLTGVLVEAPFARGTLDRLDIEPRIAQRYEYKTAGNTFTEQGFTDPEREAVATVIGSMIDNFVAGVAEARGLTPQQVRTALDTGPLLGEEAVRAGFVDRLAYRDEIYDGFRARVGSDRTTFLYAQPYLDRAGSPYDRGSTVALIYGVGTIQRGESDFDLFSGGSSMGAETVAGAFREAIESDRVRAILFRVDSPGGSYIASDVIWREVTRAREAGKPVVVSMGNVAGSGGYFVAAPADRIIAQPSTITGSIGVLAGKVVTEEFWGRFGITWDTIQVGANATMWSPIYDFNDAEWSRLQASLDRIYDDFTAKVARGRNLTREQVHEVARGRIWSGSDALRLGLVDELGGFDAAIRAARELAQIPDDDRIRLELFPARRPLLAQLLDRGRESSYPTATEVIMMRLAETIRPLHAFGRATGLLRQPGVLMTPELDLNW